MISKSILFERFVGRERELGALESLRARAVAEGRAFVALVEGEPGIGKSRLLDEFSRRAGGDRVSVVVRCDQAGSPSYAPFVDALERLSRGERGRGAATEAWAALRSVDDDRRVSAQERFHRRAGLAGEAFAAAARQGLAVIAFDDAQWSDVESLELLHLVAARIRTSPVVIVVAYRPGPALAERLVAAFALFERDGAERIALGPLAAADQYELLKDALPSASDADVERIAELAEGRPFFAQELARGAMERGSARDVPLNLRVAILERAFDLSDSARAVLACAAVFGRAVSAEDLGTFGTLPASAIVEVLREGCERQLLVEEAENGRPVFRFRHALTREIFVGELLAIERRELHRAIADSIEVTAAGERLAELAYHRWASGDAVAAMHACEAAGDRASGLAAFNDASESYRRALEGTSNDDDAFARIGAKLIEALLSTTAFDALRAACENVALRLSNTSHREDALALAFRGAVYLAFHHRVSAAGELLECCAGRELPPQLEVERCIAVANIETRRFRHVEALLVLDRARSLEGSLSPAQEARLANQRAMALELEGGRGDEVVELLERAERFAERAGDAILQARARLNIGRRANRESPALAIPHMERAAAICEARGEQVAAWAFRANVAVESINCGRLMAARALVDEVDRLGFSSQAWLGPRILLTRMLGGDMAPFVAMLDPKRYEGSLWVSYVVGAIAPHGLPASQARALIASVLPVVISQPAGDFAIGAALFASDEDLARVCEAMRTVVRDRTPRGNAEDALFDGLVARREGRHEEAARRGRDAAEAMRSIGFFPGFAYALELAGEREAALDCLREAGAVAELARFESAARPARQRALLSARELQIAELLASGATSRQVAERLDIAARTVEAHASRIYRKLGIRTRLDLSKFFQDAAEQLPT